MSFIEWRSPFDADPSLRNIVSSTTLYNVDLKLTLNMRKRLECSFFINLLDTEHSFKRKAKAIIFDTHAAIYVGDDEVQIDPDLIQRLITLGYHANDLANALTHEL